MHFPKPRFFSWSAPGLLSGLLFLTATAPVMAQWTTESYVLKPGWNAVWLPLDVSHESIAELADGDIEELWRWNAQEAGTFTESPAGSPSQTDLQWSVWRRTSAEGSTLGMLTGNAAYLVKVSDTATTFNWLVKGKPLTPRFEWSSTGLNFVGFPLQTPPDLATRSFSRFYGFDPVLKSLPSTLLYVGGPLSDIAPRNPRPANLTSTNPALGSPPTRGQAYWVQATSYTDYAGPVKVAVDREDGLNFGTERLSVSVRLSNVIDPVRNQTVTVTLQPVESEAPPAGQTANAGSVPLMVRGALDLRTGVHAYLPFTGPVTRVLSPGESTDVIFTVNRSAMGSVAGSLFQSLLRITDSLLQTRIDLAVAAETTSRAGLWGGAAVITSVDQIVGTTASAKAAPSQFPLRLILHSDAAGTVRLLQQAYLGEKSGVASISGGEAVFAAPAKAASRVSTSHFPTGLNQTGAGALGLTGSLTFQVALPADASSNPFLHAYHPDHDTMDARFEQPLPPGRESPALGRVITLTFVPDNPLGFDPAWGISSLGGTYTETITGLRATPVTCSGVFTLHRATGAATFLSN